MLAFEARTAGAELWFKLNSSARAAGAVATPPATTKLANDAMANKRFLNMGKYSLPKFDEIRFPLHISENRGSFGVTHVEFRRRLPAPSWRYPCDFVKFPGRNAPDSCASMVFRNKPSQKLGGASALTLTPAQSA